MSDKPDDTIRAPDWLAHLQRTAADEAVELTALAVGDVILVATDNTCYRLHVEDPQERWMMVTPDRPGRPSGRMRLMGCTHGMSSSIAPDRIFCGGNLELRQIIDGADHTHRTSAIHKVMLMHRED